MSASATRATGNEHARAGARRGLEAGEVAWLVTLPCAAIVVLAILLLGPPLGHALFAPGSERFFPEAIVAPEPVEHARFVLALAAAPLAVCALVASRGRSLRVRAVAVRGAVAVTQLCTVAFLVLALLAQRGDVPFHAYASPRPQFELFGVWELLVSAAAAVLLASVLGLRGVVERLAPIVRETPARRLVCLSVAVLFVAVWVVSSFNTERTIGQAVGSNLIPWDMGEAFAVLDGRAPLVDFHSQYANLVPYAAAWTMRFLFGVSAGGWTGFMVVADGVALLAVFAVFRRVVASSVLALALFLVFVAGSFSNAGTPINALEIFSVWPMRYAGPYLLAWLTSRQLDAVAPRRRWVLLGAAALVAINNLEFGLPALGGTLAALLWTDPPRSRGALLRLLGEMAAGILAGVVVVSALSLLQGGALPHFGLLLEFPRIYGIGGWVLERMPVMGFHLVVYATFLAGVVTATVRALRADAGRVLTGMLVWSGVFGLGAGSYYAGRSDQLNLIALFSSWCFTLLLLAVVVVRALAGASARRPTVADVAVLFGCGLAACAIVQTPLPWRQASRLRHEAVASFKQPDAIRLVAETTRRGQKVAILTSLGHRVAYEAGVVNVVPYSGSESMPTVQQMDTTLRAMRDASVSQVYIDRSSGFAAQLTALTAAGYGFAAERGSYVMLTRLGAP